MSIYFLDSSALAKRYVTETGGVLFGAETADAPQPPRQGMARYFESYNFERSRQGLGYQHWTLAQAQAGRLPFVPEIVGSHWAQDVQVDIVALNWREQAILLGECKWGVDAVGRSVVRELVEERTPKVLQALPDGGDGWTTHHVLFARAGFTDAAQAEAQAHRATLVDLAALNREAFEVDKGP